MLDSWVRHWTPTLRHLPLVLALAGVPLFAIALADPATPLSRREVTRPGRRISLMIDGSSSMLAPFAARSLTTKDAPMEATFFTSVAAAERFVRLRMAGGYRDLVALIEFADTAYVITPFTTDYDNILLSLSLIGNMGEWENFPDRGTVIAQAVEQAVSLFRAFDFLEASGNLMVIFSDGEDAEVTESGRTIDDVLSDAVKAKVPVYFVRISKGNTKLPDALWQNGDRQDRRPLLHRRRRSGGAARHPRDRPARRRHGRGAGVQRAAAALCALRAGGGRLVGAGRHAAAAGAAVPHLPVARQGVRSMRSAVGYLVVALALALGGRVLFGASSLEQRTADAEQSLLTLRYGDLDATYEALATEAADGALVPRVSQALVCVAQVAAVHDALLAGRLRPPPAGA